MSDQGKYAKDLANWIDETYCYSGKFESKMRGEDEFSKEFQQQQNREEIENVSTNVPTTNS